MDCFHYPLDTETLLRKKRRLRRELLALGCDVRFGHRLAGLDVRDGVLRAVAVDGPGGRYDLPCDALVLSPGHSARDTFQMLLDAGVPMAPKPFAIGVRIEHAQAALSEAQFGPAWERLPAADYKLACHLPTGRSAFTFCVCPGGEVVAAGTAEEVMNTPGSITGEYLSGRRKIPVPRERRKGNGKLLKVFGAAENNLRHIDVEIPLGTFTCVTGVSGSGKSSLVNEILYKKLGADLNRVKVRAGRHDRIEGEEFLDKVIDIDQSPIGRTPRSNPATYTGLFNDIRELFASTQDAKARGYGPGRFSFNTRGGRCEACQGDGLLKIEMHFLPDIYVPCEVCKGKRYNRETLEVHYKGKNIYEVLEMTVDEALPFFENLPRIYNRLKTLEEVGLGYVKLGQASTTLSGGEAQRVKLATELSRRATGRTFYILDEPTTGLHSDDVKKLLEVLQRLVDAGNTVLVIEHNLDVIKSADWIIDLGPEGGSGGGTLVCAGTPETVAACPASYTGQYLKKYLH